jgi:hypothetical protein
VFHGSPAGTTTYALLCIGSHPRHTFLRHKLAHYQSRVVYDPEVAYRKAQRASFDVYLAYDRYDAARTVAAWRKIRRIDENTPFVIVGPTSLTASLAGELRSGFDALIDEIENEGLVLQVMEQLLLLAGERSLKARQFAVARACAEIEQRLSYLEQQLHLSRQALARAQEHLVRAEAMREFYRRGGAKAFFNRLWPDIFEEALQRSHLRV